VLQALPHDGELKGLTEPVGASVEIDATPDAVWAVIADIPGQLRWMPEMKDVEVLTDGPVGEGTVCEATVRIFGIAVRDRVYITAFRPKEAFGIEHEGLFGGEGLLTLTPLDDGSRTRVDWVETLVPPLLPNVGWLVGRPIIARMYQRDLDLLRDVVEAGPGA
jgi:hypothetical protein